jgi:hypothetical protein
MKAVKIILLNNVVAMMMVMMVSSANFALESNISFIDGLLNLPTGARLGALLLFGVSAFPGVLAGTLFASAIYADPMSIHASIEVYDSIVQATAPLIALVMMQQFKLSNFYTSKGIYYPHVLFLCILTALLASFSRFLCMVKLHHNLPSDFGLSEYMGSILLGDLLGTLVFFLLLIFMAAAFFEHLDQTSD